MVVCQNKLLNILKYDTQLVYANTFNVYYSYCDAIAGKINVIME